jgi:predicted aspartyl protease
MDMPKGMWIMKHTGNGKMGRFSVEFEVVNNQDSVNALTGHLDPAKIRRKTISGVVDPGAAYLVLPAAVAKELGLPVKKNKIKVRYADGRRAKRTEVDEVRLYLLGRDGIFNAIVEPNRETALIGAIVLEQLDLLVDCTKGRLIPRDPEAVFAEIE